ncbi:FprA family A-type flavoprotein [Mycoplasma sp. P36-A1]|uniref:FprA family A-type flavoprotein n=1 Tax=Mycoplasma sp. P36-A1 TaxID=3252900 RepID=UPI003C2BBAC0
MIKVNKIKDNIYQIRIIDTAEKSFHGTLFPVNDGVSYASYLILDDKVTLIDTFELKYADDVIVELNKLLNNRMIDNIIINHVEPDHSESFQLIHGMYPDASVYCSKSAVREMQENFFMDVAYNNVGYGNEISTGEYTLRFFETPQVHWPDNMWTYLVEEQILFSNDAFGQLICDDVYSDKDISFEKLLAYSKEYYANIIYPNNPAVKRTIDKFIAADWHVKLVAPGHGIMIEEHFCDLIEQYRYLSSASKVNKAVIVFETIWGNTKSEALEIEKVFAANGIETKVFYLSKSRVSEIITEIVDAKYLALGTGVQNNGIFPIIADFVERLKGLKATNTHVIVFGAYGWSFAPIKELQQRLTAAKYPVFESVPCINFKINDEKKKAIEDTINLFIEETK